MSKTRSPKEEPGKKLNCGELAHAFDEISKLVDGGASKLQACTKVGEPLNLTGEAMRARYRRYLEHGKRIHGNMIFDAKQEETIVGLLQGFDLLNRPLCKLDALKLAKSMHKDDPDWDPTSWYESFIDRHRHRLSPSAVQGLKAERCSSDVEMHLKNFVEFFPGWLKDKAIPLKLLLNMDETRVALKGSQHRKKRIVSRGSSTKSAIEGTKTKCASYIPVHSACGEMIISFFVLPTSKKGTSTFYLKTVTLKDRNQHPTFYGFSETGYVTKELWKDMLQKLKARIQVLYPGLTCGLLLDQLNIHMDEECLKLCLENDIHVAFFPAHSSHIIQPADNVFFQLFKKLLYGNLETKLLVTRPSERDIGAELVAIAQEIEKKLTSEVILASWRNVGLQPFNGRLIMERAKKSNGKATISGPQDTDALALGRQAAIEVINQALDRNGQKKVQVKAQMGKCFDGEEVLKLAIAKRNHKEFQETLKEDKRKKRLEDQEARKKAREEKKLISRCRGNFHDNENRPLWRGKKSWRWCEICMEFALCEECWESSQKLMDEHEASCSKNIPQK